MTNPIEMIGVHRIVLPVKPDYQFAEGEALAAKHMTPALIEGIQKGRASIHILYPEVLTPFTPDFKRSTIMSDFYVGLLEPTIRQLRDTLFPELRIQANRDKMFVVGQGSVDIQKDILPRLFQTAWVTYAPLEQFLHERIKLGLLMDDGRELIAEWSDDRLFSCPGGNEELDNKLFGLTYSYFKALDWMFNSNLGARAQMEKDGEVPPCPSSPTSTPPP